MVFVLLEFLIAIFGEKPVVGEKMRADKIYRE